MAAKLDCFALGVCFSGLLWSVAEPSWFGIAYVLLGVWTLRRLLRGGDWVEKRAAEDTLACRNGRPVHIRNNSAH